jgi:predicted MPP superfamily phosphohydrolase
LFHRILIGFYSLYAYVCVRSYQRVFRRIPRLHWGVYALVCAALIGLFMLSRFGARLPSWANSLIAYAGGYWFMFVFYAIVFTLLADGGAVINRVFRIVSATVKLNVWTGICVMAAALLVVVSGIPTARFAAVRRYDATVDAKAANAQTLRIAIISDIHIGQLYGLRDVERMVKLTQAEAPDLIILAGDIFDNPRLETANIDALKQAFSGLEAPLGVYAVYGNHDRFDDGAGMTAFFEGTPVTVLRDECAVIEGAVVIAGRDDAYVRGRADIAALLGQTTANLPIIVVDHQPTSVDEARQAGASVYIGGHTHGGQFFPITEIVKRIYDVHHGYAMRGNTHVVVSSGYGAWAAPVRVLSRSEIVLLMLTLEVGGV